MVTLQTSMGDITLELYSDKAPETVKNFLRYAEEKFYDGTIFHRVVRSFVIQGGGFDARMAQKKTHATIKNEADNGLTNEKGSIAMARTNNPDSASSQFFINLKDNAFLNHKNKTPQGWGYTVFGKVIAGLDIVEKIGGVATISKHGHADVPAENVIVKKVIVVKPKT